MALTLFRYVPGQTFVHRTSPLIKLVILSFIAIRTFSGGQTGAAPWFSLGFYGFLVLVGFAAAKLKFKTLKQPFCFLLIYGFVLILIKTVSFPGENTFDIFTFLALDFQGLKDGVLYTSRFIVTAVGACIMFETSSSDQIRASFESLQKVFHKIFPFIPKIDFALPVSLAIGFIPRVFEMWNRVHTAAKARSPKKVNLRIRIFSAADELTALLSCLVKTAEDTGKAVVNRKSS